jgi:multidrug transporter EmrE-like cation transporter
MLKKMFINIKEAEKKMKLLILILTPIAIGVVAQIFLKMGMLQVGKFAITGSNIIPQFIKIFMNPAVFVGFTLYFISALMWLIVLSRVELSFAYPLLSVGYVLILIASWLLFKENVSLIRWSGVIVICFGVYLISRS